MTRRRMGVAYEKSVFLSPHPPSRPRFCRNARSTCTDYEIMIVSMSTRPLPRLPYPHPTGPQGGGESRLSASCFASPIVDVFVQRLFFEPDVCLLRHCQIIFNCVCPFVIFFLNNQNRAQWRRGRCRRPFPPTMGNLR